jgi:hypothetical protein
LVDDDAAKEVLPDERQCEYGFYQRANAVSITLSDTGLIQQRSDTKAFEKGVNFIFTAQTFFYRTYLVKKVTSTLIQGNERWTEL